MCKCYFEINFFKKSNLLEGVLKPPIFAVLSSDLKHIFSIQYLTSLLNSCLLVNWLYILCKIARKKKSAVSKWVTLTIGKMTRKSIKKFFIWTFRKINCFTKSSKQNGSYLMLLKAQCRSCHFWILWKTPSLDHRSKGKRIIFKSKNLYNLLI